MKIKNASLLCLLLLLTGCVEVAIVYDIIRTSKENRIIRNSNSKCLNEQGSICFVIKKNAYKYEVGGIAANKGSLFIVDGRRIVKFDLKNRKGSILSGEKEWKPLLRDYRTNYDPDGDLEVLEGIVLEGNTAYIGTSHESGVHKVDISNERAIIDKTIHYNKLRYLYRSMTFDGSALYFANNASKTIKIIMKLDVSSDEITSIPVFDEGGTIRIHHLAVVGDFVYFTAGDLEVVLLMRLNLKSEKTEVVFRSYAVRTLFTDYMGALPEKGKSLVVVLERLDGTIHFRIFDKDGVMVVDKGEEAFKDKSQELETLKKQLSEMARYKDSSGHMPCEIGKSVKTITGCPSMKYPFASGKCLESSFNAPWEHVNNHIAADEKNVYFIDGD